MADYQIPVTLMSSLVKGLAQGKSQLGAVFYFDTAYLKQKHNLISEVILLDIYLIKYLFLIDWWRCDVRVTSSVVQSR